MVLKGVTLFIELHCAGEKGMIFGKMISGFQSLFGDGRKLTRIFVAGALCLLGGLVSSGLAFTMEIDLGWGYNQNPGGNDLSLYNLQEGSIIQIILYDSTQASPPGSDAADNFDVYGYYPEGVLLDNNVYDPYSVPEGHVMAYTDTVQVAPSPDGNGNTWWRTVPVFSIDGPYDRVYIRVFEVTDFPEGEVVLSYWGISDVVSFDPSQSFGYVFIGPLDNIAATNKNYFEVIPEPGTTALLILGGTGLWAATRRRRLKSNWE